MTFELDFKLQLVLRDEIATKRAARTAPWAAKRAILPPRGEHAIPDRLAGLLAEDALFIGAQSMSFPSMARRTRLGPGWMGLAVDALLRFLLDRAAKPWRSIGAEPLCDREQSHRDLARALDDKLFGTEELAADAYAASKHRRLLRTHRHSRL